jgi:sugar phosphate isomerase/epimerase
MRLSCLNAMVGERPLPEVFAIVRDAGFDGIDVRGDFAAQNLDELAGLVRSTGLPVATVYGRITIPLLSARVADRQASVEMVRHRLRTAAALGAENVIVVPIFGEAQITADAGDGVVATELAVMFALLAELGEDAGDAGVRILLEPLNRKETHLLTSPSRTAELTRRLGNPWVRTMLDTYHTDLEGQDDVAELEAAGDQIGLVHLSDRSRQLPGDGGIDFAPVLATGFEGWMGLECGSVYETEQLARCVDWLRAGAPQTVQASAN